MKVNKRKPITDSIKKATWDKTGGRCHICGRVLVYNAVAGEKGKWHVDHIVPVAKKGKHNSKNFLPICKVCNRLKWHFKGRKIRKLFQFGILAWHQYELGTDLGKAIKGLYLHRLNQNRKRRKNNHPDWYYR